MYKLKLWMPVFIGLVAGHLFAEGERPFKVANTVRFGYSDNLYRNTEGKEETGTFVTDIVDLSFRAALSDRTDVLMTSQLQLLSDKEESSGIYPNLYLMMNHSVSSRLLLSFSEYYKSDDRSGGDINTPTKNTRYKYFQNTVGTSADYVLTEKDRLTGSANYTIIRNDREIEKYDQTTMGGGLSWKRELSPQRTFSTNNLRRSRTTYDNQPVNDATHYYLQDDAYYDATDLSAGLNHTFNEQWLGRMEAGVTYVEPQFSDFYDPSVGPLPVTEGQTESSLTPLFNAGLVYTPSPRTRLTGDLDLSYKPSDNDGYGGQNSAEVRFGFQHDITAKLMAKATARFANSTYDSTSKNGNGKNGTEDRMDLDFRLTYKLNRIHFLEAGVRHRETSRDNGNDWSENRMDIGWRVELN